MSSPRTGSRTMIGLSAVLVDRLDIPSPDSRDERHTALFLRIQAFVERQLGDTGLSPAMIAAAHHISIRQLYKVMQAQGETVAGWIRTRRLERCRRDLANPLLAQRSVNAIATRWGFISAAHFSRAFRAAYGVSPTEYRRSTTRR
ncbi:helix-turn-helix domain-containing protein [Microtetraspora malaysiensis]|uniref:helix-turn-helix domain-containing protein n=1 Tax=Microtetraspora malaysiensis TaxID=161358 RepID=UPI003D8DAC3F